MINIKGCRSDPKTDTNTYSKTDPKADLDGQNSNIIGRSNFWLILSIFAITLTIGIFSTSLAIASTPGCPDCPDWINFDGWWDKYHSDPVKSDPSPSPRELREAAAARSKAKEMASGEIDLRDGDYPRSDILIQTRDELSTDDLSGLVILDARPSDDYEDGHLFGARNLYWRGIRPAGILDPDMALEKLKELGVNETDSVLVCGSGQDATYLFWALEYLGHEKLSLLEGDVSSLDHLLIKNAPSSEKSNYAAQIQPFLLVNESALKSSQKTLQVQIIDARSSFSEYGISHLKGAISGMGTDHIYNEDFTLKGSTQLDGFFKGRGLEEEKVQLVYATPDACSLYFALKLMGYNPIVLDGDWWQKSESAVSSIS